MFGFCLIVFVIGLTLVFSSFILDHDNGDLAHDVHLDHDHGGEHDHDGHAQIFRWLSLRIISAFFVGFGAAGSIVAFLSASLFLTLLFAFGGGVLYAICIRKIMDIFIHNQGSSSPTQKDLERTIAKVTAPLLEMNIGEIVLLHNGIPIHQRARAFLGKPIPRDTDVVVIEIKDGVAIVMSLEEALDIKPDLQYTKTVEEPHERRTEIQ